MGVNHISSYPTLYFDRCGRVNLGDVLKAVRKALKSRSDLRNCKLVFFTALGEGPLLAIKILRTYQPKMIAVTFPPSFKLRSGDHFSSVRIPKEVERYLRAFDVAIISSRLPFDCIENAPSQIREMELITKSLSLVCESLPLCVQAVLQACDFGVVEEGENVIAITGDCAAIIQACPTKTFLNANSTFFLKEFLCKPSIRERAITHEPVAVRRNSSPSVGNAPTIEVVSDGPGNSHEEGLRLLSKTPQKS